MITLSGATVEQRRQCTGGHAVDCIVQDGEVQLMGVEVEVLVRSEYRLGGPGET